MSLFVGGVTLIVQFLIEVDANLHETARVQRAAANDLPALVRGEFSKISRATELFGRVESSELRADAITELVQYAAMADFQPGSLTAGVMNLQLDTARHFFRQLTLDHRVEYLGEEHDWLLGLVSVCQRTVVATSTIGPSGRGLVDERFWNSPVARRYLALQREATGRNVKIRRIFVLYGEDFMENDQVIRIIRDNQAAGVEVRVLDPAKVPPSDGRTIDFVVVDNEISYEPMPVAPAVGRDPMSMIQATFLDFRQAVVKRRSVEFERLWKLSHEPDGPSGPVANDHSSSAS